MSFGKFLLFVLLIGAGLFGLVASVCGAMFVGNGHGSDQQFAMFVMLCGIAIMIGVIFGFRALLRRKNPPASPETPQPPPGPPPGSPPPSA